MHKNQLIFLSFLFILSLTLVSTAPPVTEVQQFQEGYTIVESKHEYLKLNTDYVYNFFVYNASNGVLIDNSTVVCTFSLANDSGNILFSSNATYFSGGYWQMNILGSNFTNTGSYPYGVSCQNDFGGSLSGIFVLNEAGVEMTQARSILVMGLMMLLLLLLLSGLFSLYYVENYIGKFALYWVCHVLLIVITFIGWQVSVEGLLDGMGFTGIFRIMFWVLTLAVLPMIILSGTWIFYIHTFNEHFQKLIDKGEDAETAFKIANRKGGGWFNGQ